jgi:hypothetical protein
MARSYARIRDRGSIEHGYAADGDRRGWDSLDGLAGTARRDSGLCVREGDAGQPGC